MTVLEIIQELASPVLSIIALLISIFKKGVVKQSKTMDEIVAEATTKMEKYVEKQCKKNNVEIEKE